MISYIKNNELVLTTLGNPYKNMDLIRLRNEAGMFSGKNNRFFRINSQEIIPRDFKHLSRDSMNSASLKRFTELTGVRNSFGCYDDENNIGYKVYPYMKKHPTIYEYSIVYPAITKFFECWVSYHKAEQTSDNLAMPYDLSELIIDMSNFSELSSHFLKEENERLKISLYRDFPEFAIFYYEIYPFLNIKDTVSYNIPKLNSVLLQMSELGLDTQQIEKLISNLSSAENNTKVLELIKKAK